MLLKSVGIKKRLLMMTNANSRNALAVGRPRMCGVRERWVLGWLHERSEGDAEPN